MARSFGVDIGGSGIKGAPVDLTNGELADERFKVATPAPSSPTAVARAVTDVVAHFSWKGPIGVTFPAVVTGGVARTAANVDATWIGTSIEEVVGRELGQPVVAFNDADAAGLAESAWGAAAGARGLTIVVTLGTGIGTALIYNGVLVPNSELGHLPLDGADAELVASSAARDRNGWSFKEWSPHLQAYLTLLEDLLWPDLLVIGGGVSRKADRFLPLLSLRTPVVPAQMRNAAGIIGAAALAAGHGLSPQPQDRGGIPE